MTDIIYQKAIKNRQDWVIKIQNLKGNFNSESENIEAELKKEIQQFGIKSLINHLRLCGNIPESYQHDSTQEKLYSKYTDIILSLTYEFMGFKSLVLTERSDTADVEVFGKRDKLYAMVVCPIYQLPNRSSQIYQQAITRNVCIFTYSHLSLLLNYSLIESQIKTENLLEEIFKVIPALNPSKNATDYWLAINKTILNFSQKIIDL